MNTRTRISLSCTAIACAVLLLASPVSGFAAPYESAQPMTVATEGFEGATTAWSTATPLIVLPADGTLFGYWARTSHRAASGAYALWCGGSVPASWPKYQSYSAGLASFDLSSTADLYLSQLAFSYTLPTRGDADFDSFNALWYAASDTSSKVPHAVYPLTAPGSFSRVSYDLTPTVNLSRRAGRFDFQWVDKVENFSQTVMTGEGPSIDDVTLTGWRFGPVRTVAVSSTSSAVTIRWKRPYRAVGATTLEERPIAYRVWRSPYGTEDWTEITVARISDDGVDASLTDATVVAGATYRYVIQPWEPGAGSRYGMPSEVLGSVAAPPVSWVSTPASGSVLSVSPSTITGGASAQPGATVTGVSLTIRRDDGMYWNGLAWQATEILVPTSGAGGFSSWTYAWTLPVGDNRQHVYQVTPRATDSNGSTASGTARAVSVDTRGPRVVRARSVSSSRIEVTFSEPVSASSVGVRDFTVTRARVALVWVSADGRRATLVTSRRNTALSATLTATQGSFTDRYGNPSYATTIAIR